MKLLIFGAGALGSLLGFHLSKSCEVHLVARGENLRALQEHGLKVVRPEGEVQIRLPAHGALPEEKFHLVLLTVKSYQTEEALPYLKGLLEEGIPILSLQNGLDNERKIAGFIEREGLPAGVLGGITSCGATMLSPGVVAEGGLGRTVVGIYHRDEQASAERVGKEFVRKMREASLEARWSEYIRKELWMKSVVNSAINPLTALLKVQNGYILSRPPLLSVVKDVVEEGCKAADAAGVQLNQIELEREVLRVLEETSSNRSSTLQDIERGRQTEVDSYLGEMIRVAEEEGEDLRVLKVLYQLVKALEAENSSLSL